MGRVGGKDLGSGFAWFSPGLPPLRRPSRHHASSEAGRRRRGGECAGRQPIHTAGTHAPQQAQPVRRGAAQLAQAVAVAHLHVCDASVRGAGAHKNKSFFSVDDKPSNRVFGRSPRSCPFTDRREFLFFRPRPRRGSGRFPRLLAHDASRHLKALYSTAVVPARPSQRLGSSRPSNTKHIELCACPPRRIARPRPRLSFSLLRGGTWNPH